MENKKREIKYDYLRALAVLAIIMVHAIPAEMINEKQWLFAAAVEPVLLSFVGIYFMLSGMFLLRSGIRDIPEFYRKRFLSIIIPFFLYSWLYDWYFNIYLGPDHFGGKHFFNFLKALVEGTVSMAPHMWFLYTLIGLYFCAPFLARMVNAMSDKELKLFLFLVLVLHGLFVYLPGFGMDTDKLFEYMIFKGWFVYFVLGYALKRMYGSSSYAPFAVIGILGFVITMIQKCGTPFFTPGIHDLAPTVIAMAAGIFMFFEIYGNKEIPFLSKAASFVSRYSYSIYLIHYLVLWQFAKTMVQETSIRHYYIPKIISETFLTFAISLVFAILFEETVIKLFRKGAERLFAFQKKDKRGN